MIFSDHYVLISNGFGYKPLMIVEQYKYYKWSSHYSLVTLNMHHLWYRGRKIGKNLQGGQAFRRTSNDGRYVRPIITFAVIISLCFIIRSNIQTLYMLTLFNTRA